MLDVSGGQEAEFTTEVGETEVGIIMELRGIEEDDKGVRAGEGLVDEVFDAGIIEANDTVRGGRLAMEEGGDAISIGIREAQRREEQEEG